MGKEQWADYKKQVLSRIGDFSVLFSGLKQQTPSTDDWTTACCPFHNDKHPSFAFNKKSGRWVCFSKCGKGGPVDFLMLTSGKPFKQTLLDLGDRFHVPRPDEKKTHRPPISEDMVKQWCANLWANEEVVRWLREKRGLSDATLKKYQIGWDPKRQRNTIPVRDSRGNLVNIRFYNAKKSPKIINYVEGKHKYGSPARLYGVDELVKSEDKQVLISEGEFDRLLLCQEGFTAVTGTHGCSTFRPEWVQAFTGKDVVVIYDCDSEGQAAVHKIVLKAFKESVASGKVRSIKNVALPLKGDKDDKDVTDYFHKRGFTGADLQKLIDETPTYTYEAETEHEEVVKLDSFGDVEKKEYIDKKVQVEITVCGETSEAFHAVEEFKVTFCPRLKKGECFDCAEPIKIPRGAQEHIGSCMSTNVQLKAMLRDYCCRYGQKPALSVLKRTTVKEFFCHQRVRRISQTRDENGEVVQLIDGKLQELIEKRVYYLSSKHPKPGDYVAVGWVKSHPKTQLVTLLIETLVPQEDDYERFRVADNIEHLRAFQALEFQEVLDDLRDHVTKIYEREEILTAILLTYCSPRWLYFNGRLIRGWLVAVVLGDAGSGKSQTYQAISEYIGVGDVLSGLTGSRTGLAYALVEHKQKGWQVRVGRYPANTRRLLAVDEVQFIPERDLRTISKAMEEGFLQIDRVLSSGYESQTRLVMIGNPQKDSVMDEFSFGCDALRLFPPTVIRRTDLAVLANYTDLKDLSFINRRYESSGKRKITPEMLRAVVFWAWNLKPEQIEFTNEATEICLEKAKDLSEKYGYATKIPLVTLSDTRNKLARIAAALAVLNVSSNTDFSRLIVKPEHVYAAIFFLEELYGAENCQLDERSFIERSESQLSEYDEIEKEFLKKKDDGKHAGSNKPCYFTLIIATLRKKEIIRRDTLAEVVCCKPDTLSPTVSLLKKYSLLDSTRDGYKKTPKMNKFLRRFLQDYPDFLSEGPKKDNDPFSD